MGRFKGDWQDGMNQVLGLMDLSLVMLVQAGVCQAFDPDADSLIPDAEGSPSTGLLPGNERGDTIICARLT